MFHKISKRKFFHIALLALIIVLQFLVMLFWYLEKGNETEISLIQQDYDQLSTANLHANQSHALLLQSQVLYRDYLHDKSNQTLQQYFATVDSLTQSVQQINRSLQQNKATDNAKQLMGLNDKLNQITKDVAAFDRTHVANELLKKFDYQGIIKSIRLDSIVSRDKVAKKSFFSRLMDAMSGKSTIQKERIKVIISYEYQNKLHSGEVQSAVEKLLKDSDQYYKNQLSSLRESLGKQEGSSTLFYNLNDAVLRTFADVIADYNSLILPLQKQNATQLKNATEQQSTHRNYLIFSLTLLMFLLSLIVFRFTMYAFDLENKLVASQGQIMRNLDYKNKIMGMISHEVRSPLNIISLYSKMVATKVKDAEMREVFNSIQYTTSTLLLMTNQILDYSKNENRKMVVDKSKFYLKQELDKIVLPLQQLIHEGNNQWVWENKITNDYLVFTDAVKINQLFYNLIGNAIKFTKEGQVKLLTDVKESPEGKLFFTVTIADTGVGMSKEDLQRVFEDYYQGSNGMTSLGIGLGLKLCKEIVQLFEGEINIQSELNKGTRVSFTIPMDWISE